MSRMPIFSQAPEPGHPRGKALHFDDFNLLLREEENYFKGEEFNTKLMITRLRKIFYDKFGWDTTLIRKAAKIKGRYEVKIIDCPDKDACAGKSLKKINWFEDNLKRPKCRKVTYSCNDLIFRCERVGETPNIYIDDHADVELPEKYFCDLGHTLAGLDALNNLQIVSPLPNPILFLYRHFIFVDSNADVTTWLGDIATAGASFLFNYLRKNEQSNTQEEEQKYIDENATCSDMLGNIDAFVISKKYNMGSGSGQRVSDIFHEYYHSSESINNRISTFCEVIGLGEWDGSTFSKEEDWLTYYTDQLRNTIAFMVFSSTGNTIQKLILPYKVWKGNYDHVIKSIDLLRLFLDELKIAIEQPNSI